MATTATMTGAQFDALPYEEGRRWELVDGELVPMPSATLRHQRISLKLILAFEQHLTGSEVHGIAAQDVEFALRSDDRVRPDVFVILGENANRVNLDKVPIPGAPDLAVEIISPSETADDSYNKVRRYLKCGASEVWQVYPGSRTVQIYRGDSARTVEPDGSITTDLLPGLSIPVASLFE